MPINRELEGHFQMETRVFLILYIAFLSFIGKRIFLSFISYFLVLDICKSKGKSVVFGFY